MLIIVESPAKAKTIKNILGSEYSVEASVGHIRRVSDIKKTSDGRKLLVNGIDIDNHFEVFFEVDEGKKDIVAKLKKLAKANNNEILFATDSDREGEAISWHLSEILGVKDKSKVRRLEFHEITESAIKAALASPRPLNVDLVEAQKARQVLDKLVGYRLSPVLWTTLANRNLSAGRVQSPALILVYKRELEIEAFKPVEYWEGWGDFADQTNKLQVNRFDPEASGEKIPFELKKLKKGLDEISEASVETITSDLTTNQEFKVSEVTVKTMTSRAKPPFTTSTLQQAASSRLGMAPRATMSIAQKLYEGVSVDGRPTALITYMRTDSLNLSNEALGKIRTYLEKNKGNILADKIKRFSNKSKNAQEAHEAIRPTNPSLTPDYLRTRLEPRMHKLYTLIWNRAMATQCIDEVRELTTYLLSNSDGYQFNYTNSVQKVQGYKFFDGNGEREMVRPSIQLEKDKICYLKQLDLYQKFTTPPGRYSPASLIKKLEEQGIGRPSTYASIISTLYDRTYMEENTKSLIPTALGKSVAKILLDNFANITGSEMTSQMEDNLDKVSRHELDYETLLRDFWTPFNQTIEKQTEILKDKRAEYKLVGGEKIPDPSGKGMMVLKLGRFGEYWQNEEDPSVMYPKNFREIAVIMQATKDLYQQKLDGLKSPVTGEDLVIRVSAKSMSPYVATASYKVGGVDKAINIEKLNELGWIQKSVDALYEAKPDKGGKKSFKKFRKFAKNSSKRKQ